MDETQDAKSLVSDGRAGTGSAFILKDAWRYPIDLQQKYDAQDAATERANARLQQQAKLAQQKEAEKRIDAVAALDVNGVMPEDVKGITEAHNAMLAETAAASARGRNPGIRANTAEYTAMNQAVSTNKARAEKSRQANAEHIKQAQTRMGAGVDNPYDDVSWDTDWKAYAAADDDQRERMGMPTLDRYVDLSKVSRIIGGDVKNSMVSTQTATEVKTSVGSGVKTETDLHLDPVFIKNTAAGIIKYPGVQEKLQKQYKALPDAEMDKYLNYDEYANAEAKKYASALAAPEHKETLALNRAPQANTEDQKWRHEATDEKTAVTTYVRDVAALKRGDRHLFTDSVPGHPEWLGSNHFQGKDLGMAQIPDANGIARDVKNQVKGWAFDPDTEKLMLKTTASVAAGKGWIEVTNPMLINDIIDPLYRSSGGKGDAVQRVVKDYLRPGTAELDLSSFGGVDAADRAAQRQTATESADNFNKAYADTQHNVLQIRVGSNVMSAAENQKQVDAVNTALNGSNLLYKGAWIANPRISFRIDVETKTRGIILKYAETDPKTKLTTTKEVAIKREELAGLVNKQSLLLSTSFHRAVASADQGVAPGTRPTGPADAATTVETGSSRTVSSGEKQSGPPPKVTRFRPGQK